MYRYYADAAICIVYLADVAIDVSRTSVPWEPNIVNQLIRSRWLSRGWTLQEVIAPVYVHFYDSSWTYLGQLDERLAGHLEIAAGIPRSVLLKWSLPSEHSIATRFSWASHRNTTRVEDEAYSLLGLFDVSLPLVYGEGRRAFMRLQEEIIRRSTDHSIFAWQLRAEELEGITRRNAELLAPSPEHFASCRLGGGVEQCYDSVKGWVESFALENVGLRLSVPLVRCNSHLGVYHAVLNCRFSDIKKGPITLNIRRSSPTVSKTPANYDTNTSTFGVAPVNYLPPSKFECNFTHLDRLAIVDEEELLSHEKIPVTLLRTHRLTTATSVSPASTMMKKIASTRYSKRQGNFEPGRLKLVIEEAESPHGSRVGVHPESAWDSRSNIWYDCVGLGIIVFAWEDLGFEISFVLAKDSSRDIPFRLAVLECSQEDVFDDVTTSPVDSYMRSLRVGRTLGCHTRFAELQFDMDRTEKMGKSFFILTATVNKFPHTEAHSEVNLAMNRTKGAYQVNDGFRYDKSRFVSLSDGRFIGMACQLDAIDGKDSAEVHAITLSNVASQSKARRQLAWSMSISDQTDGQSESNRRSGDTLLRRKFSFD